MGDIIQISGRADAAAYHSIMQHHALPSARRLVQEGVVFQQDNAPIHTARSNMDYLRRVDVRGDLILMNWPAQSPDLNPVVGSAADVSIVGHETVQEFRGHDAIEQPKNCIELRTLGTSPVQVVGEVKLCFATPINELDRRRYARHPTSIRHPTWNWDLFV